ncbi:MAG: hypothetical protein EAY65_04235 [Alphaproteobacteria bacterium]|nr:MAG: hypothetical protein EAY65_04235 [Alphaproteobacteria bacterium]
MIHFKRSIKYKLIRMIMIVTCLAVILTTVALSIIGIKDMRSSVIQEIQHAAHTIGEQSKHHMRFGYQPQVMQKLEMLRLIPSVQRACLYNAQGHIYAIYPTPMGGTFDDFSDFLGSDEGFRRAAQCPLINGNVTTLTDNNIETHQFITIKDKKVGSIYIRADIKRVDKYITQQFITTLVILILVGGFAFALARNIQHTVSYPVLELARATSRVSMFHDYSHSVLAGLTTPQLVDHYSEEIASLIVAFNKMLHDLMQREQMVQQQRSALEDAKNAAEHANYAKSQIMASISHELLTPLNHIIGFSTFMKEQLMGDMPEQYRAYSEDMYRSAIELLEIINSILDYTRAHTGELTLTLTPFDVQRTLEQIIHLFSKQIEELHVDITIECAYNMPLLIADRIRFIQIIRCIISNAIKFSQPPPASAMVRIKVSHKAGSHHPEQFHIYISDAGIGMTPEEIECAFQSFRQIDGDLNRRFNGIGLGIPLAKELVDLHKGSMIIESTPNEGTRVHIILPQGGTDA